jgi:metal-responsive CopG/Arc/MetJ family transcriptional regulator
VVKSIQVLFDEPLLGRLDADDEVKRDGRSAVLRRAAAAYLKHRRARATKEAYARAYGKGEGLGKEFTGWTDEVTWPDT